MVRLLLGRGANASVRNRYGVTPLSLAATNGDATMIRALLVAGADPNTVVTEGQTVLMIAARTGRPEAIDVLVEAGANVNARESWMGETALMWAAADDHASAVRALVKHGAEIDARSTTVAYPPQKPKDPSNYVTSFVPKGQWTPLMYAAREGAAGRRDGAHRARRRRQRQGPGGRDAAARGDSQRPFRPGGAAAGQGRKPEPGRQRRHESAVRRHRHEHPAVGAQPAGRQDHDRARLPRADARAAGSRCRRQRPDQGTPAVALPRRRRARHDRRHHATHPRGQVRQPRHGGGAGQPRRRRQRWRNPTAPRR